MYSLQNKQLIQQCLEEVVAQQRRSSEGKLVDDIDERVEEMAKKANTRICPNCHTEMPKTKRKCTNITCRVDLKAAEQELSGEDVFC